MDLQERVKEVEEIVYRFLPVEEGFQKTVISAMNYTMQAGGKRIRPLLMYLTYQMFGGTQEIVYPFMAAIEMIHTYSLIHDDLPAMDDDDYRRGRLTAHKKYNEAVAILAGDGLLNYAFEVAAASFIDYPGDERIARALMILTRKPGIYGMIGGQTADVELTGRPVDKDALLFIYENKTGALLEASMMIGAVLAGADAAQEAVVEQAASKIGLAFQIQDDILDIVGEEEKLGKPVGSDEKNEKTTYVSLYGMEASKAKAAELSKEAVELLSGLNYPCEELNALIQWLIGREL